jgi:hypothetical protein
MTRIVSLGWKRKITLGMAIVVLTALVPLSYASAANNGLASQVIPRDQVAYGRTYADWTAAWWQWALSIPLGVHPLFENGPCTEGQSGPVFFLGGSFATSTVSRNCTVPAGKALFFPIINQEDSVPEELVFPSGPGGTPLLTINALRAFLQGNMDTATNLRVSLDGKSLSDLQPFRIQSTVFSYTLPEHNILKDAFGENLDAGSYSPAVGDGFYVMIKPQPAGKHLLHFHQGTPPGFTLDITYHLTVSP